ncbi:hypothetical protein MNBD_ALPHA11-937 [hydrothermal vent metagenome]|uniref:Uncharacterized protein n=1 Tax=hydrothermal vent metagenome TaxID=652676 RepID=A0A3B0TXQ0_9ZZZZ
MQNQIETSAITITTSFSEAELRAANVNPATGLATDFLNLFNEYIMLAELVEDGSMEHDVLSDWLPIDYETHFSRSGFAGAEVVLNAYRALEKNIRQLFENAVNDLISSILVHQEKPDPDPSLIDAIMGQRDVVAAKISEPITISEVACENTQSAIDALFD